MGVKLKPLSRRTFLRGAGVALGLPLLEAMLPLRTIRPLSMMPMEVQKPSSSVRM